MRSTLIRHFFVAALALAASPLAARADTLVTFDFENAGPNQVHGIAASQSIVGPASFDTGNNGVEVNPGGGSTGNWSTTRFLSDFGNRYPWATIELASQANIESISFLHASNHNPGFPTFPVYTVGLQWRVADASLDPNAPGTWTTLGEYTEAGSGSQTIAGPGELGAGTYQFRWIGYNFSFGNDSGTEFFALDNVTFTGSVPEPTSLALLGVGGAAAAIRRRRRAQG